MTEQAAQFKGNIPAMYDQHLGPVIFEPYARDLAARIDVPAGGAVLELACGTGIVTRHLRERLPAGVRLVATDLNQAMIDHAQSRLVGVPGIEWRVVDAQELPFGDREFDAVVMQFGLMFLPEKDRFAREAERVLKPGGLLALNVWDTMELNPFSLVGHETAGAMFPDDPPQFYRVPFGFTDPDALRALLVSNGFKDVKIERVQCEARAGTARSFATGMVEGNPIRLALEERGAPLGPLVDAIEQELIQRFGDDPCVSPLQAWVATARA